MHDCHTSAARNFFAAEIVVEKPDLIGLVEVDRRWLDAIAPAVAE